MPAKQKKCAPTAELREFVTAQKQRPLMTELYRQAASRLRKSRKSTRSLASQAESTVDPRKLLHELQVHQVELEMQNGELQEARDRMEGLLEKYTDLYDFAPVGYFSINELGMIVEANLTSATMLGVERAKLINQRLITFMAPPSRPVFSAFLEKAFTGIQSQTCETQLVKAGGGAFWASFRAASAVSLNEAQKWCRVAFLDISERMETEAALRESEKRYRTLFELVPVAAYSCEASGAIQNFNRRAVELWRRTPVAGDPSERFCGAFKLFHLDGSLVPHEQCPMAEVLRGKKSAVSDAELIIQRPDGSRITVIASARPLKNEQGEITGAINCFYDITDRKLAEDALRHLEVLSASNRKLELEVSQRRAVEATLKASERHQNELLEQSRAMQAQLRNLSRQVIQAQEDERREISRELHDVIGQTLTGINIRLATLKKEAGLNLRRFDRNISQTQELVAKSVETVHRFARELRPAVLDDLGLIPALHAFMKDFTARTGVHTHIKVFAGVEKLDMARRTVFFRVAQEALTNVARHAKASRAEVHIRQLPAGISMTIKDDGQSFRVDRTLPDNGGKRLGLLGMRERVKMVGGTFGVESAPGKGTTVRVEIPLPQVTKSTLKKSRKPALKCPKI
jgi:PAS domain S-box-containing protein